MKVERMSLDGVAILTPARHGDARGYFSETWNRQRLAEAGIDAGFVQDNESLSATPGTVRGLHYQAPPSAQAKLVRVISGRIRDVVVDVRRGSPGFGKWVAVELSAEAGNQLFVPQGFLHGFVTLTPDTLVQYKVDNYYDAAADGAVAWNDPDLAIDWGISPDQATVSAKDAAAPAFSTWMSPFSRETST
ncbi:MAG TPA: dTDP-4-dehydrorhamnose 3,5-epimerase [Rhodobacteraceae bacterium]|nr:dTDP-4-dehydrorhamnose 3,5-epimerase [Paracoccaceae bacterium]